MSFEFIVGFLIFVIANSFFMFRAGEREGKFAGMIQITRFYQDEHALIDKSNINRFKNWPVAIQVLYNDPDVKHFDDQRECMAKRKTKTRSLYITTEPKWKELKLLSDPEEQAIGFKSCEYFVRTEINKAKYMPVVKKWIKDHSGWPADETKIILANPDWAFSGSAISIYIHHKLGYMPENVRCHYEKRKEEWLSRGKKAVAEKKEAVTNKKLAPVISILCLIIFPFLEQLGQTFHPTHERNLVEE